MDPLVLLGPADTIKSAVRSCLEAARSPSGGRHILNLGHGVVQVRDPSRFSLTVPLKDPYFKLKALKSCFLLPYHAVWPKRMMYDSSLEP